ncbi:MAG: polyphosphate kinase [Saprospiraceae bacterium]|nr:polyphosphate kinase [Saprospiraceae bacterium]
MKKIVLSEISTRAPKKLDKDEIEEKTKKITKQISHLQHLLYAEKKQSLLVIFQGMDASGKDGATKNVFEGCSPVGIYVEAFKKPTDEEMAHDFLWRIHKVTPAKGMIQIFNRSHYEDVIIQRVNNWITEDRVEKRIEAINAFEKLLQFDNNTTILKFYMHISKDKQLEKLQERIDDPSKNWKHNESDWKERESWDKYMDAYENAINKSAIQWHIAPVDQRWYRDYFIAKIVLETLEQMNPKAPILLQKNEL